MSTARERGVQPEGLPRGAQNDSISPVSAPPTHLSEQSASQEDLAIESSTSQAVSERMPLTFINTKGKGVTSRFMPIDEALDCLGAHLYPDIWGSLTSWHLMPFRKRPGQQGYYRPLITGRGDERKLTYERIVAASCDEELRRCAAIYLKTCRRFILGAEADKFQSSIMWIKSGERKHVPEVFWHSKRIMIFYTGYVLSENEGYGRVIVHKKTFRAWIGLLTSRGQIRVDRKTFRKVVDVMNSWTKTTGYKISKKNCLMIMDAALVSTEMTRLKNDIYEHVWGNLLGKKGGKPQKEADVEFQRARRQLQGEIEAALTHSHMAIPPKK